ncbi:hypothetical protein F5Y18DRAFT_398854 [Xylariaceae sp. FL1019]|nr:hypothetical protein F5Y18DRAFT_398854 [Xylariaceae sp. FL1019]
MPKGLAESRWATPSLTSWPRPPPSRDIAPPPPSSRVVNDKPISPEQELSRFLKIVARLKWKIPFLEAGYRLAVDRGGKEQHETYGNEMHFKLDFHDFYMLIERALVHLMGVYGIIIYNGRNGNGSGVACYQPHRYHENVLNALDDHFNPLHTTFSQPLVRKHLRRAKELRNSWKDADADRPTPMPTVPLEDYNLEEILQTILAALDQAFSVTERYIRDRNPDLNQNQPLSIADWTMNSDDWDFMVDAMDWEVV